MALAQASPERSQATKPVAAPVLDLVGVSLSDLVRLYLSRLDPDRSYVGCASLVADRRLVSVRAPATLTVSAISGLLRRHGYVFTEQDGVTYVCPPGGDGGASGTSGRTFQSATPEMASYGPLNPAPGIGQEQYAQQPAQSSATPMQQLSYQARTPVDRLIASGWIFAGCIETDQGDRVSLKGPQGYMTFSRKDVEKSDAGVYLRCRI